MKKKLIVMLMTMSMLCVCSACGKNTPAQSASMNEYASAIGQESEYTPKTESGWVPINQRISCDTINENLPEGANKEYGLKDRDDEGSKTICKYSDYITESLGYQMDIALAERTNIDSVEFAYYGVTDNGSPIGIVVKVENTIVSDNETSEENVTFTEYTGDELETLINETRYTYDTESDESVSGNDTEDSVEDETPTVHGAEYIEY